MSLAPIPARHRHRYTADELAQADAGHPDLARRSANARREPGHGWAGSRLEPLSLTPEETRMVGLGIDPELERIAVQYQDAEGAVAGLRRAA